MDRRRFLVKTVGAVIGLTYGTTRASSEFEAYRRAEQDEFRRFTGGFEDQKSGLQAAFDVYRNGYKKVAEARQRELAGYWPSAELSTPTRWVEYSNGLAIQRVVDFDANAVVLRFLTESESLSEALVRHELKALLAIDLASAVRRDPISETIESSIIEAAPTVHRVGSLPRKLLLEDLFDDSSSKATQMDRLVDHLVKRANISSRFVANGVVVTVNMALPGDRLKERARALLPEVHRHARDWKIDPALMLAMMDAGSAFNPLARSNVPAFGLMQIVPNMSGRDAMEMVYGRTLVPTPSFLHDVRNNIQLGAAYLNALGARYLNPIQDPNSRQYCMIGAYHAGIEAVARSYGAHSDIRAAVTMINRRPPSDNYELLQAKLPRETSSYLQRVVSRLPSYKAL